MGRKISAADLDAAIGGSEDIPVADAGSPKRVTTAQLKDYVIAQIEAITPVVAVDGGDSLCILTNGTDLEPIDIDLVVQYAIDTIWGKALEASPDDADIMAVKDGGTTEKTITLAVLAEYVRATIEAAILDVSDLTDHTPIAGDYLLVEDDGVGKKCTFQDIITGVQNGFDTYLTALGAIGSTADTDVFYVLSAGSTEKKVTLAEIVSHFGLGVTGPGSTTENYIPQWTATNDDLKEGLALVTGSFGAGVATAVATTASIRGDMDTIVYDAADIGEALIDADTVLVDDGDLGTAQRKSAFTRIWTWIKGHLVLITDVDDIADIGTGWVLAEDTLASDSATKLATQQSIKAYVDNRLDTNLTAGTGITGGTGTVCVSNVERFGSVYKTSILVDVTGLRSTAGDDIIGVDGTANVCHLGQITAAVSGTIIAGKITCLEAATGGDPDIDLYSAVEGTGVEDDLITDLDETKLIDHGDWSLSEMAALTAFPAADEYLYLVAGDTTDADYTAGKLLIELWGN